MSALRQLMEPPRQRHMVTVPVPLAKRTTASFTLPVDVTPAEGARFLRVLSAWLDIAADATDPEVGSS